PRPALLAGQAAVVRVVLRRGDRRRPPERAPGLHRAATATPLAPRLTAWRPFTTALKGGALGRKSVAWRDAGRQAGRLRHPHREPRGRPPPPGPGPRARK